MPVQPPDPLQQQVDRRDIGDQQVCIDIKRLLGNLRRNHDSAPGAWRRTGSRGTQLLHATL